MATTPNLALSSTSSASGSAVTFLTWRLLQDGDALSNMQTIDGWAGEVSGSIVQALTGTIYLTNAADDGAGNYTATVTGITAYPTGTLINLKLDVTNTGTATLDINVIGTKVLKKISSNGVVINLTAGDLVKDKYHIFVYDGTQWIWVSGTSGDQINIPSAGVGEIVTTSGSGIQGSGVLISDIPSASGSYIVLELNSTMNNEWQLISGSGTTVRVDASASLVSVDAVGSAPITVTGSAISHDTTAVAAGTYTQTTFTVDAMGHITAASSGSEVVYYGDAPITVTGSAISHDDTAVSPGSYTSSNLTVDAKGHITTITSGSESGSSGATVLEVQVFS